MEFLREWLSERSTRYGLLIVVFALIPAEYVNNALETAQKFTGLLTIVGGLLAAIREKKDGK